MDVMFRIWILQFQGTTTCNTAPPTRVVLLTQRSRNLSRRLAALGTTTVPAQLKVAIVPASPLANCKKVANCSVAGAGNEGIQHFVGPLSIARQR
jgi:hypothetical protein